MKRWAAAQVAGLFVPAENKKAHQLETWGTLPSGKLVPRETPFQHGPLFDVFGKAGGNGRGENDPNPNHLLVMVGIDSSAKLMASPSQDYFGIHDVLMIAAKLRCTLVQNHQRGRLDANNV